MFQKPFRVKTHTSIKGSDRKRLRADLGKLFPYLSAEDLLSMVPQKDDMSMAKISSHGGQTAVVYCLQKNPIFFDLYGKIYPTVYTLWKYPDFMPVFTTWPPVIQKLAGGADLMLPGVVVKGEITLKTFKNISKGDVCAVNVVGNKAPVAVGNACLSGEDMYMSAMRGKGVEIVHIKGDNLWKFGDESEPPDLGDDGLADLLKDLSDGTEEQATGDEGVAAGDAQVSKGGAGETENSTGASGECSAAGIFEDEQRTEMVAEFLENLDVNEDRENEESDAAAARVESVVSKEEMDELLMTACLCAIKMKVKKSDLPLLASAFFKLHVQPFCPAGQSLDVKKSSFKKLSKFLHHMETKGFLKVKELSKGVDSIVEVDKTHPQFKTLEIPELTVETPDGEEVYKPPRITEVFCVTSGVVPVFKGQGYSKNDSLSAADVRRAITEYVRTNQLQDEDRKSHVQLDPHLAHIVLTREEGDLSHLKWDDLFSRIINKMQPAFQLECDGKAPVIKKGKIEPVKLTVEQRASNKKVTIVDNLEQFGIDPAALAHAVQKGVSCSTSVTPHHQKNKGMQVLVQGNQVAFISDLLLGRYKLPRKYITGLEKAPKNKRR